MASIARRAALVQRLQVEAREAPRRYLCKLALLALAGYAVLVMLLAVAVGLPLLLLARVVSGGVPADPSLAFAILLPGAFGALLLRALWLPSGIPQGHHLAPGEAPALEADVARMRDAVGGAPALDGIVIDGELNAAAVDMPRAFGLLGHRHYLVLGLPLMQLLDRDELASVIAHEFGHFGAGHGGFSGWIYRVRMSWCRTLDALSQRGGAMSLLLFKFYGWYVPYFNAYSFVLARRQEYEADAAAARAAGAEAAAGALIKLERASRRVQARFWPALFDRARMQGHPPAQLHADLARALRDARACDLERLCSLAARDADPDDTHPTLPQRLDAIGAASALRPSLQDSAAEALLGPRLPGIERHLDAQWRDGIRAHWRERYDGAAGDRARLAELEARGALAPGEALEHARLVESLRVGFDALPLYERVLAAAPDSALAHYRAGLLRLRRGEGAAGVVHLRQAMTCDPGAIRPLLADLERFELDPELDLATAAALAGLRATFAPRARALDARDAVAGEDEFLAHDLDDAALGRLAAALARNPRVHGAWLVRKRMDLADDPSHYVVLLDWRGSVASEAVGLKQLSDAFDLPGSHTVFTGSGHRDAAQRVRRLCREPVYRKGGGMHA